MRDSECSLRGTTTGLVIELNCNATIAAMRTRVAVIVLAFVLSAGLAAAAEHPALAKARVLYNAGDYDGAIGAAGMARNDPASADAAALVIARARLERYRLQSSDPVDLDAAREALAAVRLEALMPRDRIDHLVGLGQALYLENAYGAAAELFGGALTRADLLPYRDRSLLLEWWATALDREAQLLPAERRGALMAPVLDRMARELEADPGHAAANYWLAVAARASGDTERAWHAAVAAWVRAPLRRETADKLRQDIDRFVTTVLVSERARSRPSREQQMAVAELRSEWDQIKEDWK